MPILKIKLKSAVGASLAPGYRTGPQRELQITADHSPLQPEMRPSNHCSKLQPPLQQAAQVGTPIIHHWIQTGKKACTTTKQIKTEVFKSKPFRKDLFA